MNKRVKVVKSYTIGFSSDRVRRRFERLVMMMDFSSKVGHSGTFAMPLDGDGSDVVSCDDLEPGLNNGVSRGGSIGFHVEIAYDDSYGGAFFDFGRTDRWRGVNSEPPLPAPPKEEEK